ncbi:MAG: DNA helicase RecQ [Phycisphaerales bacterium]|nr:DNA helicase RecQ [Phycisphaerales bacterium]
MLSQPPASRAGDDAIRDAIRRVWGFSSLRPLQAEAIRAGIEGRDALVVLPTGGGKSLCYQVPPLITERTDVVISPLIALMKDQVDALRANGYPAVALHSGMSDGERVAAEKEIAAGRTRLVFVAPERVLSGRFLRLINPLGVRAFAIDEAHCISHWGHDFRPEYRWLARLRSTFPDASLHAYTATATPQVRQDIVDQLQLREPHVLVGSFDRPNLTYRVRAKLEARPQIIDALRRHAGQAAIVYCISRRETESLADALREAKFKAACYHAGLNPDQRRRTQEDFANERIDVVCATVAFGMGVDRSDVRCVIHAAMPKSIEHYQQEAGRAGRDGLEAECLLLFSPADALRWESLLARSLEEQEDGAPEWLDAQHKLLREMRGYANAVRCRHRMLVEHFGQRFDSESCGACDVCLGEVEELSDANTVAQKVLSCVARTRESFGIGHVVDVLRGARNDRVQALRHHELSTYGLLKHFEKKSLTDIVYQLVEQDLLTRDGDELPVLRLNPASWEVMRGERDVRLRKPVGGVAKRSKGDAASWEGVSEGLFEALRGLRRQIADEAGVPPYVIFSDATLRDMARQKPKSPGAFLNVYGVGETKRRKFGAAFIEAIKAFEDRGARIVPE